MKVTVETLQIVLFLMPGFIGASVHGYIRNTTLATTGFIILAVLIGILSAFATTIIGVAPSNYSIAFQGQDYNSQIVDLVQNRYFWLNVAFSIAVGILTATLYESRRIQHLLETCRLTRHYSIDDVWEQTFRDNNNKWLILHLKDGSKLIGYAHYYSMADEEKTLTLREASLVVRQPGNDDDTTMKLETVKMRGDLLLTDMSDISWIEFIDPIFNKK